MVGLGGHGDARQEAARGAVTVDYAAMFTPRFEGGPVGLFEATRFALGRKNAMRLEVNGSEGSLSFDFEDMNVLQFFDGTEDAESAGSLTDHGMMNRACRPFSRGIRP